MGTNCHPPLWLETEGGKQKNICANTEGLFRISESIPSRRPSRKAENACRRNEIQRRNRRRSRFFHRATGQSLRLFDKGGVKGGECGAVPAGGQVQGVGKIQALPGQINRLGDYAGSFRL